MLMEKYTRLSLCHRFFSAAAIVCNYRYTVCHCLDGGYAKVFIFRSKETLLRPYNTSPNVHQVEILQIERWILQRGADIVRTPVH
jgi:hypothetical protein